VITVAVIEDRTEIRESLRILFEGTDGLRLAGSFGSMEEALRLIALDVPDVALVDIGLPGMSGIAGIRELRARYSKLVPLIFTVYEDDERIFEALCAGACGYLLKKTPPAMLLAALTEAVSGGAPMSPDIARRVVAFFHGDTKGSSQARLTPHEMRILRMLVDGETYKTAAATLGVSINTISFHVRNIYEKLQVHSKSEAVAKALRGRFF
jgi:DNA-binding NarL/FixJ family response regulator